MLKLTSGAHSIRFTISCQLSMLTVVKRISKYPSLTTGSELHGIITWASWILIITVGLSVQNVVTNPKL